MSHQAVAETRGIRGLLFSLFILLPCHLSPVVAQEDVETQAGQPLNESELQTLQGTLNELKGLAPRLRVLVRTLRRQVGFDPREIHNIERGVSESQKELERLIAMHRRNAYNRMRAHFMADNLRRKHEMLMSSLAYVQRRIQELDEGPGDRAGNAELKRNDDSLVELLGLYSELVGASVQLLQDKGI